MSAQENRQFQLDIQEVGSCFDKYPVRNIPNPKFNFTNINKIENEPETRQVHHSIF